VSGMDSRLIVRATPRTFTQLERLLAEIDTPRRNLRISVRMTGRVNAYRTVRESLATCVAAIRALS